MKQARSIPPLHFEPQLVEEVVFRAIHAGRVPPRLAARIQHRRDQAYDLPPGEDRDDAFSALALEAFRGLDLDRVFREMLEEFPLLSALAEMRVRRARSRSEEHAELFVQDDDAADQQMQRAVVLVFVSRFLEPEATRGFLRREFLHLSDMLDERFAYRPDSVPQGRSPAWQNLFRDRYRLLWELSIAGRLERRGGVPAGSSDALRPTFESVFGGLAKDRREEIFRRVGSDDHPRHALLVECAGQDSVGAGTNQGPDQFQGSGVCPICRFPTFDWMETPQSIAPSVVKIIRESAPAWQPESGICSRCHELCESRAHDSSEQMSLSLNEHTLSNPELRS